MRSKKKKSICGFCNEFCGHRWCPASLRFTPDCIEFFAKVDNHTYDEQSTSINWEAVPRLRGNSKQSLSPERTESEQFLYDLIRVHGGLHD